MSAIFEQPDQTQVAEWYNWVFSLTNQKNPFHPVDGGQYWNVNNTNENLIWLAGVTATTQPANKPSQIPNMNAVVQGSEAKVVYNGGNGNAEQNIPAINPREITINKGDNRDLYIPVSTEIATATKYPKLQNNLAALAQKIIDREDVKGAPPAFVEFQNSQGEKKNLSGSELKTGYRVNGAIDQLTVREDDVFMLPSGTGPAAFSDYAVILKRSALTQGKNTLRFGVEGQFFSYTVEYTINA
jgi:hypothetical protein